MSEIDDDICENHQKFQNLIKTGSFMKLEDGEKYTTSILLQEELKFGSNYRTQLKKSARKPLPPKKRPVELPFEVCRAKQKIKRRKEAYCGDDLPPKPKKLSMLEKTIMSQEEYMNWLAMPVIRYQEPIAKSRKSKKCDISPCPPRFVQLAIPQKRRIWCAWNEYQNSLPVDMLLRFQQILHADQNLELKDADYYYKKMGIMAKKSARKKKRLRQKRLMEKEKGKYAWVEENISTTVEAIMNFLKEEQLFSLNYKQLLLSNEILTALNKKRVIIKPSRSTKSTFEKSFIETSDKIAVWMDSLTKFVDIQAVESEEDIPPISISSIEKGEEEEEIGVEEEEGEIIEEEEKTEFKIFIHEEDEHGFDEDGEYEKYELQVKTIKTEDETKEVDINQLDKEYYELGKDIYGEGMAEDSIPVDKQKKPKYREDVGSEEGIDINLLKHLLQIYEERSPEDYLANEVNKLPGYTYEAILNKLKQITVGDDIPKKSNLEEVMIEWLNDVAPDEINKGTLKAIHEYACALLEELRKTDFGESELEKLLESDYKAGQEEEEAENEMNRIIEGNEAGEGEGLETELDKMLIGDETGQGEELGTELSSAEKLLQLKEHEGEEEVDIVVTEDWETGVGDEVIGEDMEGFYSPEENIFEEEADVIYEKLEVTRPVIEEGEYIRGHKPPKVYEHSTDTICCLSLKIWAVWLLEVIHNAHMWTKWMHEVIRKIREFASIVRNNIKCIDGNRQVLYKSEWAKFVKETEGKIIAWRQYSAHINELSDGIIENFRNKKVFCCPKCLQDHLIKNVVTAHETLAALTDAINCTQYWRRCLDGLIKTTSSLTSVEKSGSSGEESSSEADEIEELSIEYSSSSDDEDIFELEEIQKRYDSNQ
ncbi:uncharacterized protein LOC130891655 isoform X2 [Diorhabda carinulata]|uniref:uncharacterized protein LOC130891655 isoform X2 n=1 Tax=Diorhabda carinulata TaxID=1163345 RepID=UPI0025A142AE|nr:uncharacterized protein LOC130891655 isoform X2 [Diorhabda carinulata]